MKRGNQLAIPITDDPKKAAAWWRAHEKRERKWRERSAEIDKMVEAILGDAGKSSDPGAPEI